VLRQNFLPRESFFIQIGHSPITRAKNFRMTSTEGIGSFTAIAECLKLVP